MKESALVDITDTFMFMYADNLFLLPMRVLNDFLLPTRFLNMTVHNFFPTYFTSVFLKLSDDNKTQEQLIVNPRIMDNQSSMNSGTKEKVK